MLTLLLACVDPSDAQRAANASVAIDFRAAEGACRGMSAPADRDACLLRAIERFGAWSACDALTTDPWRGECGFLQVEREYSGHEMLEACGRVSFARQCRQHAVERLAAAAADQAPTDARTSLGAHALDERAELDFWRAWARARLLAGRPVEPESCEPAAAWGRACRDGARHEIRAFTADWYARHGCDAAPPPWAASEDASRWAREERARRCAG